MGNLYITCGCPGSGKSTWAKKRQAEGWSWNSRDAVRFSMITPEDEYFSKEDDVYDAFVSNIQNDIYDKYENIIADASHLTEKGRKMLLNRLSLNGYNVIYVVFTTPLDVAIERNNLREGRAKVPETAIRRMYNSFTMPTGNIIKINQEGEVEE